MDLILATKLHIPSAHPNTIPRSHLIARLDEELWHTSDERFLRRLTLIAAPAGYGKSTLLYEWTTHLGLPVAWITFDESDNDASRFLQYLIAALRTVHPNLGETDLALLSAPDSALGPEIVAGVMTSLVNQIAGAHRPFLLVFDDYHTLQEQGIHAAVRALLDHLPENLSLAIATRADPPLSLARLRARRQMVEVRAGDLRFAQHEADTFLRRIMQLELTEAEVVRLTESTEGWIAGLQMAALALRGRGDRAAFIRDFSGRERFVIDYLLEEVLSRQPEGVQAFLLETSMLERMTGPLCDALLLAGNGAVNDATPGRQAIAGQHALEYLERANLFVVPLDRQSEWYRYHRLFADLLRHRLRSVRSPEYVARLHEKASEWCENNGLIDEALHYAALSGNQQRLARLVQLIGNTLTQTGQVTKRVRLLRLLSLETLRANPGLCIECAWSEMFARPSPDLRQAEVYLQMAERGLAENPDCVDGSGYPVAYRAAHTRAILSRFRGDSPQSIIQWAQKALDLLPRDDFDYRCSLLQNLAMAYLVMADLGTAWTNLQQCWDEARASGSSYVAIAAAYMMSRCLQTQGRLGAMDDLLRTALAELRATEAADGSASAIPALGLLYVARAWLLFEPGHADGTSVGAAEQAVKQGAELCAMTAEHYVLAEGHALQARMLAAQGDAAGAHGRLEEMAANWPEAAGLAAATRLRLMLAEDGEDQGIESLSARLPSALDERVYPVAVPPDVWHWQGQMALIRLLIARRRWSSAGDLTPVLRHTDRLLATCAREGWQMQRIELHLLRALALDADRDVRAAIGELAQALASAETYGFYQLLREEGKPLADLLRRTAGGLTHTRLLARLVVDLGVVESRAKPATDPGGKGHERPDASLLDPLTERELEVLRLMATGLSQKEMAERLVVTVGTIKTHTSHIYQKLDVPGYAKAVAKARSLHLI